MGNIDFSKIIQTIIKFIQSIFGGNFGNLFGGNRG